jgi:stage II sporulation protein M
LERVPDLSAEALAKVGGGERSKVSNMPNLQSIYQYYKNFLFSARRWMVFAAAVFVVAAIVGSAAHAYYPSLIETILEAFRKIAGEDPQLNASLAAVIFRQNLQSSLIALAGGILLGTLSFLVVWMNGFIIGYVITYFFRTLPGTAGEKIVYLAVVLLPHGVFELPIVLVSAALGMRLGISWMAAPEGQRTAHFNKNFLESLKFIPLLVVVLAVAAVIEVFVSGQLGKLLD